MREFTTAARVATETTEDIEAGLPFDIKEVNADGTVARVVTCHAFKPNGAQLAVTMAGMGRHSSDNEKVASIINFFVSVLDERSSSYIVDRLLDRRDAFGLEEVQDIMEALIEEWSGRPTVSPSGSTSSPESTGPTSTPVTPALI